MNDQELRALVREAIAKQLGQPAPMPQPRMLERHASHAVYAIARNDAPFGASGDADNGPCIIEPSVPCTHCNYCKSHGH